MATQLFLRSADSDVDLCHNYPRLVDSATSGFFWRLYSLATTRGSGAVTLYSANTVAGPTTGVDAHITYLTPPIAADVTISGTITANIWASESSMNANVAINVLIEVIRADTFGASGEHTLVQIVKSTNATELGTSAAVNNFTSGMTSGAYSSVTVNRGDRLRIRVFGDDGGGANMASGFTFAVRGEGTTGGADGDSYITFTENFSFESAPAGTVIYLTDTASDVATASVDREAWTSRGSGVTNDVTNTAAGWTSPIQVTDTAGGTVVDWFTKPLQAVTLSGSASGNARVSVSSTLAYAVIGVEIARVDEDGTNPFIWSRWNGKTLPSTSETTVTWSISGDDLAISNGQRLRIRLYIDDSSSRTTGMDPGYTVTTYYGGTSGGASGDAYITFPVTLTEYTAAAPGIPVLRRRPADRFLTRR